MIPPRASHDAQTSLANAGSEPSASDSMVERVARALWLRLSLFELGEPVTWAGYDVQTEATKHHFREDARAAISAMREPTDAMTLAAEALDTFAPFSTTRTEVAEDEAKWRAMIDQALKETT